MTFEISDAQIRQFVGAAPAEETRIAVRRWLNGYPYGIDSRRQRLEEFLGRRAAEAFK